MVGLAVPRAEDPRTSDTSLDGIGVDGRLWTRGYRRANLQRCLIDCQAAAVGAVASGAYGACRC